MLGRDSVLGFLGFGEGKEGEKAGRMGLVGFRLDSGWAVGGMGG